MESSISFPCVDAAARILQNEPWTNEESASGGRAVFVISHRGLSGSAPENTLEAFEAVVRLGVHGIETDVRVSADEQLILFHDRTVKGMAVGDLSAEHIRQLVGYHVPTLAEAVASWPELLWVLELKTPAAVEPLVDFVGRMTRPENFLVISFWHQAIREVALRSTVPCGLLVAHCPDRLNGLARAVRLRRVRTLVWCFEFCSPALIVDAAARGWRSFVYGPETRLEHEACRRWGFEGVITDYPAWLLS
jgi:glycerophosphoryl diester phosphodiesterase